MKDQQIKKYRDDGVDRQKVRDNNKSEGNFSVIKHKRTYAIKNNED